MDRTQPKSRPAFSRFRIPEARFSMISRRGEAVTSVAERHRNCDVAQKRQKSYARVSAVFPPDARYGASDTDAAGEPIMRQPGHCQWGRAQSVDRIRTLKMRVPATHSCRRRAPLRGAEVADRNAQQIESGVRDDRRPSHDPRGIRRRGASAQLGR